jgi:hypothetical protein
MSTLRFGAVAVALASLIGTASAQTAKDPGTATTERPARETPSDATNPPVPGANSFTEAQARERIAAAGFQEVKDLKKDPQGVWRGMARKGDTQVNVALDYRGNIVQE